MDDRTNVYLDCCAYSSLMNIVNADDLLGAMKPKRMQILLSPVSILEILPTFECDPETGKRLLGFATSVCFERILKNPKEMLLDDIRSFANLGREAEAYLPPEECNAKWKTVKNILAMGKIDDDEFFEETRQSKAYRSQGLHNPAEIIHDEFRKMDKKTGEGKNLALALESPKAFWKLSMESLGPFLCAIVEGFVSEVGVDKRFARKIIEDLDRLPRIEYALKQQVEMIRAHFPNKVVEKDSTADDNIQAVYLGCTQYFVTDDKQFSRRLCGIVPEQGFPRVLTSHDFLALLGLT